MWSKPAVNQLWIVLSHKNPTMLNSNAKVQKSKPIVFYQSPESDFAFLVEFSILAYFARQLRSDRSVANDQFTKYLFLYLYHYYPTNQHSAHPPNQNSCYSSSLSKYIQSLGAWGSFMLRNLILMIVDAMVNVGGLLSSPSVFVIVRSLKVLQNKFPLVRVANGIKTLQ